MGVRGDSTRRDLSATYAADWRTPQWPDLDRSTGRLTLETPLCGRARAPAGQRCVRRLRERAHTMDDLAQRCRLGDHRDAGRPDRQDPGHRPRVATPGLGWDNGPEGLLHEEWVAQGG